MQLIRRFSNRAQFVIVTHQKRTMDAADVLYGVSMGGDGITKVVSRRLPREADEGRIGEEEEEASRAAAPPPFAGVAEQAADGDDEERDASGLIGEQAPAIQPRDSAEGGVGRAA